MTAAEYTKCAKIIRKSVRAAYGSGFGSAWSMLVPSIRAAIVRAQALTVIHGWADDDRGRAVTESEIAGLLQAVTREFGDEIE